jgi:hypothetical protein
MINLKLTDHQAWMLTQLFENILSDNKHDSLFFSLEENEETGEEILTMDYEFKAEIEKIDNMLIDERRVK